MSDDQDTTRDDTPRDERRVERDAKRDMIDANNQELYELQLAGQRADAAANDAGFLATLMAKDEQEMTED